MSFFNVSVSGIEGIEQDVTAEITKVQGFIPFALNHVGTELSDSLKKHIHNDWYLKYTPAWYQRRTDDNSLGTPLGADSNISISVGGNHLNFLYQPTGKHAQLEWYERDGDEIIEALQTGNLFGDPPARPFWNNFVMEAEQSLVMESFIDGMKGYGVTVIKDGSGDVYGLFYESELWC